MSEWMSVPVLVGAVLAAGLLLYLLSRRRETDQAFSRLDARLDEQGKRSEAMVLQLADHNRVTEDVVRCLDRDLRTQQTENQQALLARLAEARQVQQQAIHELQQAQLSRFGELQQRLEQRHGETYKSLQGSLQTAVDRVEQHLAEAVGRNTEDLSKRMTALTEATDKRLHEISGQVDKRLSEGFEKTVATFADVQKRLELIDVAQQRITELSSNVVSLQEVLADRTSRGTFGEVQLQALVSNVLPEAGFHMQYTLSNGRCVDCMLFLPEPTGKVPIDAKFPFENFRRKADPNLGKSDRAAAERAFLRNVSTHIQDIAAKYILPGETADFAVMFIPAEAVFAEIHGSHPNLIEQAHRLGVMVASPTTLWAILTTAASVLKDAATREQVNILQEHLRRLGEDFGRFQTRMDHLAQHIDQAHRDVEMVHTSARKITKRFDKIERLELGDAETTPALAEGVAHNGTTK